MKRLNDITVKKRDENGFPHVYKAFMLAPDNNMEPKIRLLNSVLELNMPISAEPWEDVAVIMVDFGAGPSKYVGINLYGADMTGKIFPVST